MRKQTFPGFRYASPGAPLPLKAVYDMTIEWASGTWPTIPWSWLIGVCLVFWAGMLTADFFNKQSDLRTWWNWRWRLFDLRITTPWDEKTQCLRIVVTVVAARNMPNCMALLHVCDILNERNKKLHTITIFSGMSLQRDQNEKIVLAKIPIQSPPTKESGHAYWLEDKEILLEGAENVASLEVRSGNRSQSYCLYIRMAQKEAGTKGRFFVIDEDHQVVTIGMPNCAREISPS